MRVPDINIRNSLHGLALDPNAIDQEPFWRRAYRHVLYNENEPWFHGSRANFRRGL